MQQMRQLPNAVGEARRRPRVVGVAVDRHRRARQLESAAARERPRGRRSRTGRRPRAPARGASTSAQVVERDGGRPAEDVLAAGELDHLGQPVPGAERRVDPLGEEDAPSRGAPDRGGCALDACRASRAASSSPRSATPSREASRRTDSATSSSVRGSSDTTAASTGHAEASSPLETAQTVHRSCVTITSGAQLVDQLGVDRVQRPAVANRRADRLVDLEARHARRDRSAPPSRPACRPPRRGQRHSSDTPTSESIKPRSAMISVALGRNEQMRIATR